MGGNNDSALPLFPESKNFFEWQNGGNDTMSLWQDPMFEDPANHRYILKTGSPALSLGIQQIDLDHIGIQGGKKGKK